MIPGPHKTWGIITQLVPRSAQLGLGDIKHWTLLSWRGDGTCLFVWVCVSCVCTVFMYVHTYIWRPEDDLRCYSAGPVYLMFLRQSLSLAWNTQWTSGIHLPLPFLCKFNKCHLELKLILKQTLHQLGPSSKFWINPLTLVRVLEGRV